VAPTIGDGHSVMKRLSFVVFLCARVIVRFFAPVVVGVVVGGVVGGVGLEGLEDFLERDGICSVRGRGWGWFLLRGLDAWIGVFIIEYERGEFLLYERLYFIGCVLCFSRCGVLAAIIVSDSEVFDEVFPSFLCSSEFSPFCAVTIEEASGVNEFVSVPDQCGHSDFFASSFCHGLSIQELLEKGFD